MNTDILCEILFRDGEEEKAVAALETVFDVMREFEKRYSRFQENNELYRFNQSTSLVVSPDLFEMLTLAKKFHQKTGGLFNPSILPALEKEGYCGAPLGLTSDAKSDFSLLQLDPLTHTASKPANMKIDLGGIGKGYIVDQAAQFLKNHFDHFLIDAGGDIFLSGSNQKEGYPYWAIEVEQERGEASLLLLSDMAVATSGRNRRHWVQNGKEKHHLIDPRTETSAVKDFISVTVLAKDTATADALAKSLFIAGREHGPKLAEIWKIPALFREASNKVTHNQYIQPYVWHP
jgi:thiamine biosynthesis lipoprotein